MKTLTLLALSLACAPLAHAQTPHQVLNLAAWKLTLPVDSNGGTTGPAISIANSQLVTGYAHANYFYVKPTEPTVVQFWCPSNGATTSPGSGSDHPRTELLENGGWRLSRGGTLFARAQVLKYPPGDRDIIIGQIHGGKVTENNVVTDFSSAPFVMLHVKNGQLFIVIKGATSGNTGTVQQTLLTNVGLQKNLVYKLRTDGTRIYVAASCVGATPNPALPPPSASGTVSWSVLVPTAWQNKPVRFAAGAYVQDLSSLATDGGRMAFTQLTLTPNASGRPTATPAAAVAPAFELYPTRATDQLHLSGPAGASLTLTDALGRPVRQLTLAAGPTTLPVAGLPAGSYLAVLSTATGRQVRRFVKE